MASSINNDRLSYGLTILVFGILFLLDKIGILAQIPYGTKIVSVSSYFLIAGIIFVCTQPKKFLSWTLLVTGIFLNVGFLFNQISDYTQYIIPVALVVIGLSIVFSAKNK